MSKGYRTENENTINITYQGKERQFDDEVITLEVTTATKEKYIIEVAQVGLYEGNEKTTPICGRVTLITDIDNIKQLENIYRIFDNSYDYELFMDDMNSNLYLDITSYSNVGDERIILKEVLQILKKVEGV